MLDAIMKRRSIRRYVPGKPVDAALVDKLLAAAMMAPSARNRQPWHFIVCDDRAVLDELHRRHPASNMLQDAPLCIVVCADSDREAAPGYATVDCAAATQNVLLAAHELGLGTCWMGVTPVPVRMRELGDYFELPPGLSVFSLIAVGWPDETVPAPDRFDREKVHFNRW